MSNLTAELNRLYFTSRYEHVEEADLLNANGTVKAMVLELSSPADWRVLSAVWQGVQQDLALPAPAIAVSGTDGLQLWFSVEEPVPVAHAIAFLTTLTTKYISGPASQRVRYFPFEDAETGLFAHAQLVPAEQALSGNWSAFVSSDLASIFGSEPWLDVPPNLDAQADILARIRSMTPAQFHSQLEQLPEVGQAPPDRTHTSNAAVQVHSYCVKDLGSRINLGQLTPKEFLENVMRDLEVPLELRIDAAKALLQTMAGE